MQFFILYIFIACIFGCIGLYQAWEQKVNWGMTICWIMLTISPLIEKLCKNL